MRFGLGERFPGQGLVAMFAQKLIGLIVRPTHPGAVGLDRGGAVAQRIDAGNRPAGLVIEGGVDLVLGKGTQSPPFLSNMGDLSPFSLRAIP